MYLNELEKIANQISNEYDMNPDPQPRPSEEEVQEAQTGQDTVKGLTPEEIALKQQMDESILQQQQEEEEAKESQREIVDRALLEGAAEQVISEITNDELKDLLIEKAGSEMINLGSFAKLIDISSGDYEEILKEAAAQTLDYMSYSNENFVGGLQKVSSELFSNEDTLNSLFSRDGVDYVFTQLAKLEDYDGLQKNASEGDLDSLVRISENEGEVIGEAADIVGEAYEEALKEIAKEDIKESIKTSNEYNEGVAEGIETVASYNDREKLGQILKEANVFNKVKDKVSGGLDLAKNVRQNKELRNSRLNNMNTKVHEMQQGDNSIYSQEMVEYILNERNAINNLNKDILKGQSIRYGIPAGVGLGAAGIYAGTRNRGNNVPLEAPLDHTDFDPETIDAIMQASIEEEQEKQANFFNLKESSMRKQANPINYFKDGFRNAKNLKVNQRELSDVKTTLENQEKLYAQQMIDNKNSEDTFRDIISLSNKADDLSRNVSQGEVFRYGIPAVTSTTGAIAGGKILHNKLNDQADLDKEANFQLMNEAWKGLKGLGSAGAKKIGEVFNPVDKMSDLATSADNITTDYNGHYNTYIPNHQQNEQMNLFVH